MTIELAPQLDQRPVPGQALEAELTFEHAAYFRPSGRDRRTGLQGRRRLRAGFGPAQNPSRLRAVDLAVRRERELRMGEDARRQHVGRKYFRQPFPQAGVALRSRCAVGAHDERLERPLAAAEGVDGQHHGAANPGKAFERGLDLPGLDAVAPDLDLLIAAAEELDQRTGPVARHVSRSVEPITAHGMLDESRRGLLRVAPIPHRQPFPGNVELALDPVRTVPHPVVQNVQALIGQRVSVGNAGPVLRRLAGVEGDSTRSIPRSPRRG